jgi:hypothetical protein
METRNLPPPDRLFWIRDNDSYWTHPRQQWLMDWIQYGKDTHTANVAFGPSGRNATAGAQTVDHGPLRDITPDDSSPPATPWLNKPSGR